MVRKMGNNNDPICWEAKLGSPRFTRFWSLYQRQFARNSKSKAIAHLEQCEGKWNELLIACDKYDEELHGIYDAMVVASQGIENLKETIVRYGGASGTLEALEQALQLTLKSSLDAIAGKGPAGIEKLLVLVTGRSEIGYKESRSRKIVQIVFADLANPPPYVLKRSRPKLVKNQLYAFCADVMNDLAAKWPFVKPQSRDKGPHRRRPWNGGNVKRIIMPA